MVTHNMEIVADTDRVVRLVAGPRGTRGGQPRPSPQPLAAGVPTVTLSRKRLRASTMTKVYINGKLFDKADAKISVYDHGLLYGDGVFEGIRIYGGKVFRLREHIDRLYDSARHIALEIPLSREQMIAGRQRHGQGQQQAGRLHPPGRHARRRHARPRSAQDAPIRRSSSSSTTSASIRRSSTRTAWRSSRRRRSAIIPTRSIRASSR